MLGQIWLHLRVGGRPLWNEGSLVLESGLVTEGSWQFEVQYFKSFLHSLLTAVVGYMILEYAKIFNRVHLS
jgi:hypothetical protein